VGQSVAYTHNRSTGLTAVFRAQTAVISETEQNRPNNISPSGTVVPGGLTTYSHSHGVSICVKMHVLEWPLINEIQSFFVADLREITLARTCTRSRVNCQYRIKDYQTKQTTAPHSVSIKIYSGIACARFTCDSMAFLFQGANCILRRPM